MNKNSSQLDLFSTPSLNPTYEIKHQIRLVMDNMEYSRDELADEMIRCAVRQAVPLKVTRATLDGWCKDSDPARLPSLPGLVIFCKVMGTVEPIKPLLAPLGCAVLSPEEVGILEWGKAEMEKKKAARKARLALEAINND